MKKFMTIWVGELISNIGSGMIAFVGVLMVVVALVLGSRKGIREIEVSNCEYELKNVEKRL